jgi:hypothetical protein
MRIGVAQVVLIAAIGLVGFAGCSVVPKLDETAAANNPPAPETTGSIAPRPAAQAAPAFAPEPQPQQFAVFWGVAY